ncbi:hypothetical protein GYMLUDRAFT_786832 [Collybiopsis luxurians FD-317 M1]|nr:hypothetical protein GYMLUDRAFT_786832 [Collybiopsis luxurians FD-317 M1]
MTIFYELHTYTVLQYMLFPAVLNCPPPMVALVALARVVVGFMGDAILVRDGLGTTDDGTFELPLLGHCFCWSSSILFLTLVDCPSNSSISCLQCSIVLYSKHSSKAIHFQYILMNHY